MNLLSPFSDLPEEITLFIFESLSIVEIVGITRTSNETQYLVNVFLQEIENIGEYEFQEQKSSYDGSRQQILEMFLHRLSPKNLRNLQIYFKTIPRFQWKRKATHPYGHVEKHTIPSILDNFKSIEGLKIDGKLSKLAEKCYDFPQIPEHITKKIENFHDLNFLDLNWATIHASTLYKILKNPNLEVLNLRNCEYVRSDEIIKNHWINLVVPKLEKLQLEISHGCMTHPTNLVFIEEIFCFNAPELRTLDFGFLYCINDCEEDLYFEHLYSQTPGSKQKQIPILFQIPYVLKLSLKCPKLENFSFGIFYNLVQRRVKVPRFCVCEIAMVKEILRSGKYSRLKYVNFSGAVQTCKNHVIRVWRNFPKECKICDLVIVEGV